MPFLTRPRRPRRSGEWTEAKAVTFIVTLAATQSVTLAARRATMSRKSVYALKSRDPAFAAAWNAALAAGSADHNPGDEARKARKPRISPGHGNRRRPGFDAELRDRFFSQLAANRSDSVARPRPLA